MENSLVLWYPNETLVHSPHESKLYHTHKHTQLQLEILKNIILHKAYLNQILLNYMQQKLKINKNKLIDWTNLSEFMRSITEFFKSYDFYSNGKRDVKILSCNDFNAQV